MKIEAEQNKTDLFICSKEYYSKEGFLKDRMLKDTW